MADPFGTRLREYRFSAGISQAELARRVNYSPSYLSKVENGVKPPNATLARLCDEVLGAGGALIEAARNARNSGAGAGPGTAPAGGPEPVVAGLRASFEQLRALGRQTSPAVVLDSVVGQARAVLGLAVANQDPTRSRLLLLAARIAEYAGWLSQELGNDAAALGWTRHAAELGLAGGDREIAGYALVREAGLALYRQDAIGTVELARRVRGVGNRTLGLAARREAQGHALAGDGDRFERAMDRAATLLESSTAEQWPVGPTVPDPVGLAHGWSLVDLGRAGAAATELDAAVPRLPSTSRRSRARFGVRRALAHALSGEIEESCRTLAGVLDDAAQADSATVRLDLRELARTFSRCRGNRAVGEIYPRLSRVLHG